MIVDLAVLKMIPNLDDQTCFGCGEANPHGLQMKFLTDSEKVFSFVEVSSTMTGWDKTVHGGILSTMMDEIMGWTVIHLLNKIGVTKSMSVDFLKPVVVGDKLTVVGFVAEVCSERSACISAEIYNETDMLCLKATGNFSTMKPKTAVQLGLFGEDYMKRFEKIMD